MIIPDLEELARNFWVGTGLHDIFPRDIEQVVALKLPLVLIKLPRLNVPEVGRWLGQRNIAARLPADARDLCGCLVAYRGRGIAFVCGADQPNERRLTIAHEVAHFLVDYLLPRQQVIHELGEGTAQVLDGLRPPIPAERAAAILSHVRLGAHVHVLPRPGINEDTDVAVAHVEDRADRLALELMAPQVCVRDVLDGLSAHQALTPDAARAALATHFGLPAYAFIDTIQRMFHCQPPSFVADIIEGIRRRR
jgi:hypothetical protein